MPLLQGNDRSATPPLIAAALLFAVILGAFEVLALRPGLGAPEELANLGLIEAGAAAWRGWLRFGGGALTRGLQAILLAGPWAWQAIYLFNAGVLAASAWGLWRLARLMGREDAGAWALALGLSSPFAFLQLRTTFAYVLVPALLLGLAVGLRSAQGKRASFALGLAAALAWLDYEGWVLCAPALAAAWATAPRERRARGRWVLAGAALGLAAVLAVSAPYLAEWWAQRSASLAPAGPLAGGALAKLRSFFFGGQAPRAMGLEQWPAFPYLAWPGLVAGVLWAPGWLWLWAAGGLLGLAAAGPLQEPNRAIVAWPALLLISGFGTQALLQRLASRKAPALLAVALLLAPALGYLAFDQAIRPWDAAIHGQSRRLFKVAAFLEARAKDRPVEFLGLDRRASPAFLRFAPQWHPRPARGGELWVLMPRSFADAADPRWGRWVPFHSAGGLQSTWLLQPTPAAAAWLRECASQTAKLDAVESLPAAEQLRLVRSLDARGMNAWAWTAHAELRLRQALRSGQLQPGDVLPLLQGPCLSRAPLEQAMQALASSQPQLSAELAKALHKLDQPGERWKRSGIRR